MYCVKSTRFGNFSFQIDLLEKDSEILRDVMSKCIIVRAEFLFAKRTIDYVALSELFDEVSFGEIIPDYDIIFTKGKAGKTTWKFNRKN